jgi:hypothetical protein
LPRCADGVDLVGGLVKRGPLLVATTQRSV